MRMPSVREELLSSALKSVGKLDEGLQGLWVAQRVFACGFFGRLLHQYLLYRHLYLLTVERPGDFGYLQDLIRHMPGRGILADAAFDLVHQPVVELRAFFEDDEERHRGAPVRPLYVYDEAILDLLDLLDGAVDLARPHPYPSAVYGRVAPAVDNGAATRGDLDPVPVPPHSRIHVEVALPVPLSFGVIPEVQRHRGHGLGDYQLSH